MKSTQANKDLIYFDVVSHTMISLYMEVAYSTRYVPPATRTEIILKRLKSYSKMSKNKPIKSDIRQLILFGRKNSLQFEKKMLEIVELSEKYIQPLSENSDQHKLKSCLESLIKLFDVDDRPDVGVKCPRPNTLYFDPDAVLSSFDDLGNLVTPIEAYLPNAHWDEAVVVCAKTGWTLTKIGIHKDNHLIGRLTI